jgi:phosphohistidine phosphatase SixA
MDHPPKHFMPALKGSSSVVASALLALLLVFPASAQSGSEAALWAALASGGHCALMRHALAPGSGDPAGFRLDDCATQRTLSAAGREQARALGERFRKNGAADVAVFSSLWCRCLETARLLDLGAVTPLRALNSFFRDPSREAAQTAALRHLIHERAGGKSLVLVTHQVNITALTGVFPQSGEIVVVHPEGDDIRVIGRMR